LKQLLTVWDSPLGGAAIALLRTAVQHQWCARLLREFLLGRIIGPVFHKLGTDQKSAQWRASLVASQMTGLVLTRYILKVEPLASAPQDAVIAALAPTLQRYIDGDLPEAPQP
ncbi:MAG TPA: TetR/AcrR family transcriptional regulator, partial [Limnochordia bacterium]|nr:TetR/AcrR family transcriptional regulator [Limnochordia bacterium]